MLGRHKHQTGIFKVSKIKVMSLVFTKGLIISKELFGVFKFSKKTKKRVVVVVKTNSFIQFLREFQDTKSPFDNT